MGLARSEGEAGQLGWRGAEEVARLGVALRPTRLAAIRRWRWHGRVRLGRMCPVARGQRELGLDPKFRWRSHIYR